MSVEEDGSDVCLLDAESSHGVFSVASLGALEIRGGWIAVFLFEFGFERFDLLAVSVEHLLIHPPVGRFAVLEPRPALEEQSGGG